LCPVKGTVPREFTLPIFLNNQTAPPGPNTHAQE
jgi:hypothetical protein